MGTSVWLYAGVLAGCGVLLRRNGAGTIVGLTVAILGGWLRTCSRRAATQRNVEQVPPAMPAEKEKVSMANSESWLSRAGKWAASAAKSIVSNIRPAAEKAQQLEPLADLALGPYSADFNLVVDSIVGVEQAYAVLAPQGGAGTVKAAKVLELVKDSLLPKLVAAGLTSADAEAYIEKYIDAVVIILNGPTATADVTAAAA